MRIHTTSTLQLAVLFLGGCAHVAREEAAPRPEDTRTAARGAVRLAFDHLARTQYGREDEERHGVYTGDWPQFRVLDAGLVRGRKPEVSPFIGTFIHHALEGITAGNAGALGVDSTRVARARELRRAAAGMMRRFEVRHAAPYEGAYGFWPEAPDSATSPPRPDKRGFLIAAGKMIGYPPPHGTLAPVHWWPAYVKSFRLTPDADDTATVYAALFTDAALDGGEVPSTRFQRFFSMRRDDGNVRILSPPGGFEGGTGAFLTWFRTSEELRKTGEVDLVVNANVLFCLGRYGLLDRTPGVADAIRLINRDISGGRHREITHVTPYYPDNNSLAYAISRAYREGGVRGLRPAVDILAGEVERAALWSDEGTRCHWDGGAPHASTAFAVLALLNAGRSGPVVEGGIRYLLAEQDAGDGSWDETTVCHALLPSFKTSVLWRSSAFTTAIAMEALGRYLLETAEH